MNKQAEVSGEVKSTESYFEILAKKCPHLCEEIFGYLNAKDLKECFLVNKQCNAIIGKAPKCMEKFVLTFPSCWEREEDEKQGLLVSGRKYQNIELRDVDIDESYEEIFKNGKGKWKLVKFNNCKIDSGETLKIIIESICQTVEELTWHFSFYFHHQNVFDRIFNFPKLKKLKIYATRFPDWFATCKTLMKFSATIYRENDVQVERVQQLLQRNPELKVVKLLGSSLGSVFDSNFWKNVTFQLDELVVRTDEPPSSFMAHFLETQIKSLKKVAISGGFDLICLEVIFRMRELQKLEILDFGDDPWILEWNELELPQNNSIESFYLRHLPNIDILKAFIKPLPNLKHLSIHILNDRIFNILSTNLRNLESIDCWDFRVSVPRVLAGNSLPNLKKLDADQLNYSKDELEQLRTEPTNRNQVHALLRNKRLQQYTQYLIQ